MRPALGHSAPMPKKTISSTQVRLMPELAKRVDALRCKIPYKVSMNSFVNSLISVRVFDLEARDRVGDSTGDTGESSFKK